jgi:hypothetical protein
MQNLHAVPVMSKRQKWFLLLGGVVVAIALMALVTQDREPSYQGRSLSNWIASYDPSNLEIDSTTNQVIAAAMRQFGTNALPFLLQWLRYETPRSGVKSTLRSLVRKLPYGMTPDALASWAHIDQQEFRAFSAVAAFALLGDDARPAIPELSKLMNDPALSLASQPTWPKPSDASPRSPRMTTPPWPCSCVALKTSTRAYARQPSGPLAFWPSVVISNPPGWCRP